MNSILIKNGLLVLEDQVLKSDLLIVGETISQIASSITEDADTIIDAQGKIVLPGGIDAHTHMDLPAGNFSASDSFETGSRAALWGGTTTLIDFANQKKGSTLREAFDQWQNLAKEKSFCDYGFHVSVTDVNEKTLQEIPEMFKEGVTSFKTFMAYPAMKISESDLEKVMRLVKELGGIVTLHAEIGQMIEEKTAKLLSEGQKTPAAHPLSHPEEAEIVAVRHFIALVEKTGCSGYVVHTSCPQSVEEAKGKGHLPLWYETCPQYLERDERLYQGPFETSAKAVMSPPLRPIGFQEKLWEDLLQKKIHVVATDHCPFTIEQKRRGQENFTLIPNGGPGVEDRVELLYNGAVSKRKMSLTDFSKINATNAAKLFGLYPKKGVLKVGSDADITILDPNSKWKRSASTHHMNCDYNLYEGLEGQGKCETVLLRGELAIHQGKFLLQKPQGRYLKREKPFTKL